MVCTFVEKPDDNPSAQITRAQGIAALIPTNFMMWPWRALVEQVDRNVGGDVVFGLFDEQPPNQTTPK